MEDFAEATHGSCVVSILPYRLRALKRRRQAARAAAFALPSPPSAMPTGVLDPEVGVMRAGIRHTASGRMTVIHERLTTVLAILEARAAGRRGLLEDERLEAVLVDQHRAVFAGSWP
jgi:hypothetical protein